jgi:DNA mismatch repair protein MutL
LKKIIIEGNILKISILDESVSSKIAAGEIIEKPASIIRELIDNSIDAGSTIVDIRTKQGGISEIAITDNGEGMSKEDLELSILKHSTSKIKTLDDLYNINSMGFRGEALYSIQTVSKLSITTNNSSEGNSPGYRLFFKDGEKKIEPVAAKKGTKIEVSDLFYNLPARKKFLKTPSSELNSIKSSIIEKVFSDTGVSFSLYNDDKLIFRTPGEGNFSSSFFSVYKNESSFDISKHELYFNDQISLTLYYSDKEVFFNTRKFQSLYVNNRPITCSFFYTAASNGYSDYISPGRHPLLFVFIKIAPELIDVNIHPAKREIKFQDQQLIFSAIVQLIKGAYSSKIKSTLQIKNEDYSPLFMKEENTAVSYNSKEKIKDEPVEKSLLDMFNNRKADIIETNQNIPYTIKNNFNDIKILGTVFNTYLTIEKDDKLYFIDQHALEESYLYNLKKEKYLADSSIENLLIPIILEPDSLNDFIVDKIKKLNDSGFSIEENEGDTFTIRAIPSILSYMDSEDVKSIIKEWLENDDDSDKTIIDQILITASCREAVKKGDKLSPLEIKNLADIFFMGNITNCPHGRPVFFEINKESFEKNFQRKK